MDRVLLIGSTVGADTPVRKFTVASASGPGVSLISFIGDPADASAT